MCSKQTINQSVNQSVNQSIDQQRILLRSLREGNLPLMFSKQSINQSINQSMDSSEELASRLPTISVF